MADFGRRSYRSADCGWRATDASGSDGADGFGSSTGRFEKSALIASQPSGRITSRYDSRCPNALSGPHDSVAA